jgi:cobalt/nickel transport protein
MKKYFALVALIMAFLAVLIPFASSNPDGLEKVATTFGVEEHAPFWNGIVFNYSFGAIENPYISTLAAGVFGTLVVLLATFLLGTAIAPKKTPAVSDPH